MWRRTIVLRLIASTLAAPALAACGGEERRAGEQPTTTAETATADTTTGEMKSEHGTTGSEHEEGALGARVWAEAGCGNCHTLAAAGSTGTVGPNLDAHFREEHHGRAVEDIVRQVREGGRRMPAFEGRLTDAEMRAVAVFVVESVEKSRK